MVFKYIQHPLCKKKANSPRQGSSHCLLLRLIWSHEVSTGQSGEESWLLAQCWTCKLDAQMVSLQQRQAHVFLCTLCTYGHTPFRRSGNGYVLCAKIRLRWMFSPFLRPCTSTPSGCRSLQVAAGKVVSRSNFLHCSCVFCTALDNLSDRLQY